MSISFLQKNATFSYNTFIQKQLVFPCSFRTAIRSFYTLSWLHLISNAVSALIKKKTPSIHREDYSKEQNSTLSRELGWRAYIDLSILPGSWSCWVCDHRQVMSSFEHQYLNQYNGDSGFAKLSHGTVRRSKQGNR